MENKSTIQTSPSCQKQNSDRVWYGLLTHTDTRAGIFTTIDKVVNDVDSQGILDMRKLVKDA